MSSDLARGAAEVCSPGPKGWTYACARAMMIEMHFERTLHATDWLRAPRRLVLAAATMVPALTACAEVADAVLDTHVAACQNACEKADSSACKDTCRTTCEHGCNPGDYTFSSTDRVECHWDSVVFTDEGVLSPVGDKTLSCSR